MLTLRYMNPLASLSPLPHRTNPARRVERRWYPFSGSERLGLLHPASLLLLLLLAGPGLAYEFQTGPPRLYKDLPSRISYHMDEGLTLSCSVLADDLSPSLTAGPMRSAASEKTAARSAVIISWYKVIDKEKSKELSDTDQNYAFHNNGRQLQILPISTQQQPEGILKQIKGSYYCQAKNGQWLTRSRKCVVNPVNTPTISLSSDSSSIYAGGTAVLSCKIQPEYAHSFYRLVKWRILDETGKPIRNITQSNEKYSIVRSIYPSELHIRGVNEEDASRQYICTVESIIRHRDRTPDTHDSPVMRVKLNTAGGYLQTYMQISHRHAVISVVQGRSVELPCVFHGSAVTVYYVWYRSNQKIYPLDPKTQKQWGKKYQIVAKGHGNLRITNLEAKDSGIYECEGLLSKEEVGTSQRTRSKIRLNVSAPLGVTVKQPQLNVDYKEKAVIRCKVHGYPFSRVYWLHDGRRLTPSANVKIVQKDEESSVVIKAVDRHSEGVYQCFSESGSVIEPQDNAQGRTVLVPNKVPPELVAQYPAVSADGYAHLRLTLDSKKSQLKRKMRLRCNFVGSPPQRITWYLDDSRIPLNSDVITLDDYQFKELTVNLEKAFEDNGNPQDGVKYGGEYKAVATSPYGKAECRTFVEIDTKLMIREFTLGSKPIEGRDYYLKCYVLGRNSVKGVIIEWTKVTREGKRQSLPLNHRHALKERGRTLLIKNVKKDEDDGQYKCTAKDKEGHTAERTVTLDVMRVPVINNFVDKYHLVEGQDKVTVTCNIKNQADKPWYAWWIFHKANSASTKPVILHPVNNVPGVQGVKITYAQPQPQQFGRRRISSVPYFVKANTWVMLEIEQPERQKHAGNYTCVIQNPVGKSNQTAQVSFKPKIKFDKRPPQTKTVVLNSNLMIQCSAKGDKPKPIVEWKYFNKSLHENYGSIRILEKKTKGRISQDPQGTLRVNNVTKTDPTQFMCFVSLNASDAEAISQVVKVNVRYPAEILPMKDQECKAGARLNLSCIIEGDEPITSKWQFYDRDNREWKQISPCGWKEDCYSGYGARQAITTEQKKLKERRGRIHTLRFAQVQASHQTRYRCKAKNEFNENEAVREIKVTVISAPGKPENVKAVENMAREITLKWSKPEKDGNKPITYYIVSVHRLRDLSRPVEKVIEFNRTVHENGDYSFRITNLRPSAEYLFKVAAVNDVGVSEMSTTRATTTEAKPEAPVQNLTANGTGSDTIHISWKPPPDDKMNGYLKEYRVCLRQAEPGSTDMEEVPKSEEYWSHDSVNCKVVEAATDKHGAQKEFTNLPKFTKYYIRVEAINSKGESPPAFTKTRTLEDVPQQPPIGVVCSKLRESMVKLQWNPPDKGAMNGILTGYTIRYFESNDYDDESTSKVINISSNTDVEVSNLQHYTNYTFKIYAVNSKGSGPPSKPARCETRSSQPTPPAEVKLLPVNSTCVVASWRHPEQSNGRLTKYLLYFGAWSNLPDVNSVEASKEGVYLVTANESEYFNYKFFCGLINGEEYQFAMRALNHATYHSDVTKWTTAHPMHNAPARFIGFNRTVVINNNMNIDLSCEAVGSAPVQVTLTEASYTMSILKDSFVHLKNVQDNVHGGKYRCRADNGMLSNDEIKYQVQVRVIKETPPVAPKLMSGRQRLHSVEVEWSPLGSAQYRRKDTPIKRYWLTYLNHYSNARRTVEVSANNRTFFLSNLTCGTVIEFQIKAENKIGNSTDSKKIEMRTRGSKPIVYDNSRIISSANAKHVLLNLTSLFRPGKGCPPLKYRVLISPKERSVISDRNRIEKIIYSEDLKNKCCINITTIHHGSTYRYVVEATNAAGSENSTGTFTTPNGPSPTLPKMKIESPRGQLAFWQRPAIVVIMILAFIAIIIFVMAVVLFLKRRQTAEDLREQAKGPVKKCVNDLKDSGKVTEGLPGHSFRPAPMRMPSTQVGAPDDDRLSNDGSVDSDGNINPYATFTSYETTTIDRHEIPDGGPRELGAVTAESGRMRQRIQKRKRAPFYEPQGPKQYENDSVSGTIAAAKRRSNSLDRLEEIEGASAATYNQGYATGGGGQMGRSFHEPKYPGDHMSAHYRGGSVLSSTTMSSNHDELSQAYEYGRRARYESALNTTDGFNVDENLDLHTGSGSSETTDPGIRQFTQQPPMPDEQRQATCEVPLFNKTPTTDRRRPSYASETYEPMDESYYRRNVNPRPLQHPSRQVPLPEPPPGLSSTLGRPRVGATAASTRAGLGAAGAYRNRADSDSIYGGGHVYDSTDNYYSGANYGRRPGEFSRQPARIPGGRYYNGAGAAGGAVGGASERHPLVPGSGPAGGVVRPMPYGARGGDPDEAKSLLVGSLHRRYSVQRAAPGSAGSSSSGGTATGASTGGGAAAALPAGARRASRPPAAPGDPAAPGLLIHVPGDEDDDSEGENIYTREFTVV